MWFSSLVHWARATEATAKFTRFTILFLALTICLSTRTCTDICTHTQTLKHMHTPTRAHTLTPKTHSLSHFSSCHNPYLLPFLQEKHSLKQTRRWTWVSQESSLSVWRSSEAGSHSAQHPHPPWGVNTYCTLWINHGKRARQKTTKSSRFDHVNDVLIFRCVWQFQDSSFVYVNCIK